jgi:hypothetical protein
LVESRRRCSLKLVLRGRREPSSSSSEYLGGGIVQRISKPPHDWKKRLEESIRKRESPFGPTQSEIADAHTAKDLADSRMQKTMLQLLQQVATGDAAELLWRRTSVRPDVQKKVPVHIHRALYWIAWSLKDSHREPSASEYREIVKALEQVRDDRCVCSHLGRKGDEFRVLLEQAADWYRGLESSAQRTKPRDIGQRLALSMLRGEFRAHFGNPMSQAVGLLMEAAFGGSWPASTVRVRASEWRC